MTTTSIHPSHVATAPGDGAAIVAVTAIAPILWGMTYVVTTEFLPPGRPLLAATVRALSAGFILAAIAPRQPHGVMWVKAAVLGVLNIGAFFALLFVAAYRLPGGVAATLGSIQPLITAGLAVHLLHERLRTTVVLSGFLGVAGVALVVLRPGATVDAVGIVAGLAGAASMATGTVLAKRWGREVPLATFTAWQLIAGGVALLLVLPVVEGVPTHLTERNLAGFGWFAVSTAAAYLVWFRGVAALSAARVSLLGLLSPIVATVAGWMLLDQTLTVTQLLGATIVLIAITLGQRRAPVRPVLTGRAGRCHQVTGLDAGRNQTSKNASRS